MPSLLSKDPLDTQTEVLQADSFIPKSCWSNKSYVEEDELFVWFDSLRLINNLSVKQGRVFLGWTSTKLG